MIDPSTSQTDTTNTFNYTFYSPEKTNPPLKRVLPKTYEESLMWVEGRRRGMGWATVRGWNLAGMKGESNKTRFIGLSS